MKQIFKFKFTGRKAGAIGKLGRHTFKVDADNLGEAKWRLYYNYEHITNMSASVEEPISTATYLDTALIKPEAYKTCDEQ